jgi:hypothetical protein
MLLFKGILETVGGVVFEVLEVKGGFFQTQVLTPRSPLTLMTSKTPPPNIFKIASNKSI